MLAVTSSPSAPSPRVAAVDELAVLVAQRHRQPVDLRLGGEGERLVRLELEEAADAARRNRVTSSSLNALSSDSIGTACRTLAKRARSAPTPTFSDRLSSVRRSGKRCLDLAVALAQRVVFGVRDGRRVLLVIALVVLGDFRIQPRVLGLGLLFGEIVDGDCGERLALPFHSVMAGLVPAIHVLLAANLKTWMPGTRPGHD